MKRRNAILLGLAFLLMAGGYIAWCWGPFYLPPKVTYNIDFLWTPQAKDLVEKWRTANAGWDDMPLAGGPL